MEIHIRKDGDRYCHVKVKFGDCTIDVGLLTPDESSEMAEYLRGAAKELDGEDPEDDCIHLKMAMNILEGAATDMGDCVEIQMKEWEYALKEAKS